MSETEQRALKDITNANDERSRLSGEIEALRRQFKAYQGLKAVEVSRLELRLRGCLQRLGPLGGRGEGAEARCDRVEATDGLLGAKLRTCLQRPQCGLTVDMLRLGILLLCSCMKVSSLRGGAVPALDLSALPAELPAAAEESVSN